MSPEKRAHVCRHEAGHAIVAMHYGVLVRQVTVGTGENVTRHANGSREHNLMITAAGIAVSGIADPGAWADVIQILDDLKLKDASGEAMRAAVFPLVDVAREILERHADTHDALTERLIDYGSLEENELAWFARRVEERNIARRD